VAVTDALTWIKNVQKTTAQKQKQRQTELDRQQQKQ